MMLTEEIKVLIGKNLPSLAAGELKEYIAEAERAKLVLVDKNKLIETMKANELKYLPAITEHEQNEKAMDGREVEVEKREVVVGDCEKKLELKSKDVVCASEKVELLREFVGLVFRNTVVRSSVLKDKQVVVANGHDCQGNDLGSRVDPVTEKEETEETKE